MDFDDNDYETLGDIIGGVAEALARPWGWLVLCIAVVIACAMVNSMPDTKPETETAHAPEQ